MVDVTFALLLVSASIGVLAVFLTDDEPAHDPVTADRTAETLAATTMKMEYSVEPVTDPIQGDPGGHDPFDANPSFDYERTAHGPVLAQFADAAVTEARFPDGDDSTLLGDSDERLTRAGIEYRNALEGGIRDRLTGAGETAHVVALWRPYESAAIEGRVEAGPSPPPGVDYSTATMTLPSSMPSLDESEIKRAYRGGDLGDVADLVARSVVRGYFPPSETQLSLERNGLERQLVVYRYQRMAELLDLAEFETDPAWRVGPVSGTNPVSQAQADARMANDQLRGPLSDMIREDLEDVRDEQYGGSFDAETVAELVSPGDVKITIYTWNK